MIKRNFNSYISGDTENKMPKKAASGAALEIYDGMSF